MVSISIIMGVTSGVVRRDVAPTPPAPDRVRVYDNGGGRVDTFLEQRELWRQRAIPVEVSGQCFSACTLFLDLPTMCARGTAEFWFHAPYMPVLDNIATYSDVYTQSFTLKYPPAIREWIAAQGGLTSDWIILKGEQMKELVPACDA